MVIPLSIVASVAEPAQLAAIRSHSKPLVGTEEGVPSNHAELFRELSNISVVVPGSIAILVVDLMVRLLWDSNETSVVRVVEIEVWHPVVALVGHRRDSCACSSLCLRKVHACCETVTADDGVNVVGWNDAGTDNWVRSFDYEGHAAAFEDEVGTLLSLD